MKERSDVLFLGIKIGTCTHREEGDITSLKYFNFESSEAFNSASKSQIIGDLEIDLQYGMAVVDKPISNITSDTRVPFDFLAYIFIMLEKNNLDNNFLSF